LSLPHPQLLSAIREVRRTHREFARALGSLELAMTATEDERTETLSDLFRRRALQRLADNGTLSRSDLLDRVKVQGLTRFACLGILRQMIGEGLITTVTRPTPGRPREELTLPAQAHPESIR
jgi:CelD/BcsL family acetyltransferase involved in cellulose biosynthesis